VFYEREIWSVLETVNEVGLKMSTDKICTVKPTQNRLWTEQETFL